MAEPENFADAPVSLTERRAFSKDDCRLLEPRDLLINILRQIDRGELKMPQGCVVLWADEDAEGWWRVIQRSASITVRNRISLFEVAKSDLLDSSNR